MEMSAIVKETKKMLKMCKIDIILKFIISIIYRGTLLVIPILWGKAIDLVTIGKFDDSYRIVFITLAVTIGYYISACLNQIIYYKLYNILYKKYSVTVYESIVNNSLYSLSRFKLGEFSNIVNNDIDIVVAFLSDTIIKIVRILEFLIIYYYFYTIDFSIFIVTVILSIFMFLGYMITGSKTKELNQKRKYSLDKKTAITHEVFHTVKEIKGFYVFQSVHKRVKEVCQKYLMDNAIYNTFSTVVKQIILAIIEITRYLLVIYGMYLCSKGKMEVGTILVIYTYYGKVIENYDIIGTLMIGLEDFKVSLKRLNRLLEFKTISKEELFLPEREHKGNIKFIDVLYGNKKDPILNNVSLTIPANSITIITGRPGTGKTGVFDLLMKMNRKHSGEILIDGDPYEKIHDDMYYNLVSLVRKESNFFDLSIKDNLMLVCGNFSKVKKVCEQIGIHDEIMSLNHKYDTQINDKSQKVSNNLKISIAIARVLLKDSKIMMFDETLSMLDKKYQDTILDILMKLKKDHTIILISREEKVLGMADKVITFDNNQVKNVRLQKEKVIV